jgi:epoxyqueuosine reductase QueG
MGETDLKRFIEAFIVRAVEGAQGETAYRRPLVGFADADDPAWARLRREVEPTHLHPGDLLPGAKTVVAFFVPFAEEIVKANRRARGTARQWAVAYLETNVLINAIARDLAESLGRKGVRAAAQPSTHNWDPETLVSGWSHKSAAAVAGLGSFGLHRMLITDLGCAGRFGSLAVDARIEPTSGPQPERCLHLSDGTCTYCVKACPVGALKEAGPTGTNLDKFACYDHLLRVEAVLGADACGKCAVGPCALRGRHRKAAPRSSRGAAQGSRDPGAGPASRSR